MGLFDSFIEVKATFDLLGKCDALGSKVYFDDLHYIDKNDNRVDILSIRLPSLSDHDRVYTNLYVNVDGEDIKLLRASKIVSTMVYCAVQKIAREFNK